MLALADLETLRRFSRPILLPPRRQTPGDLRRRVEEHNASVAALARIMQPALDLANAGLTVDEDFLPQEAVRAVLCAVRALLSVAEEREALEAELRRLEEGAKEAPRPGTAGRAGR